MLNKKRTMLIGFATVAVMAFWSVCPVQAFAAFDPSSPESWMEDAKNPVNPDSIYPHTDHDDLTPAGISYSGYDNTKANIVIEELRKYVKATDEKGSEILDAETSIPLLVESLLDETDKLYTQYELLNIEYYRNVNDEKISDEASRVYQDFVDVSDRSLQVLRDVLKGPNGDILKKDLTKDQGEYLSEYEDMTKREKKLIKKEDDLVQEYDKLSLNTDDFKADNKDFVRIYSDLIDIRTELAEIYGYDSYPEYAYEKVYNRDYSCEDARALAENVKKYIVPIFVKCTEDFYSSDIYPLLSYADDGDTILGNIAPYISELDPELRSAFNYLRRNHTYDLDYSPDKMDVGYTVDLPQYGALFIFNTPYREAIDYTMTIHEFGHYNAGFHDMQRTLLAQEMSYDLAEIQSQGLEMLFLDYYDEIFKDASDAATKEALTNILSSVVTGCMYDEFQQEVFANPDMTGKEMNALSARLAEEYGMVEAGYENKDEAKYSWAAIPHTYESPMYYISYATSALSALDILAESMDNRGAAVDKYMEVSAVDHDLAYIEGLKACGLNNVFEKGTIKEISEKIEKLQ